MSGAGGQRLGADPSALDALAAEVRAGAALLSRSGRVGGSLLVGWAGPDADATAVLVDRATAQRRRAAAVLERCASQLARVALEQRRVSASAPPVTTRVDLPGGGGRLVQRIGAASASTVVVVVPGVGTDRGDRDRLLRDASRLWWSVADHVDDPSTVAVVSWLGYDPPDLVVQGIDVGPAASGAERLVGEVRSLRRAGATRVTVVGHSYGGLVAGRAAVRGMDADAVVQLGSPGVGVAGGTRAIGRAGTDLVAVRAVGDPIGAVAGHAPGLFGEDPVGLVPGLPTSLTGHGAYLSDPVLLDALASLAVGSLPAT